MDGIGYSSDAFVNRHGHAPKEASTGLFSGPEVIDDRH